MALDWDRIEDAKNTSAGLWRLVDELATKKPSRDDLIRIEQLLKFGNLAGEVQKRVDEALAQHSHRSTQRLEPIWRATLNTKEHKALRDTMRDDEFVSVHDFRRPTAVAPPNAYPIDMALLEEVTAEVAAPELAAFDAQPDTEEIVILRAQDVTKPISLPRDPALVTTTPLKVKYESTELSGMFLRPDAELVELMPSANLRLRYAGAEFADVSRKTLLHLFRRGVLMGAEVFDGGAWIPVSEHPRFTRLRASVAAEIRRIVSESGDAVTKPTLTALVPWDVEQDDELEDVTNVVESADPSEDTQIFEQELFAAIDFRCDQGLEDSSPILGDIAEDSELTGSLLTNSDSWPFSGVFKVEDVASVRDASHDENTYAATPRARGMTPEFPLPPSVKREAEVVQNGVYEGPKILEDIARAEAEASARAARQKDTQPVLVAPVPTLARPSDKQAGRSPVVVALVAAIMVLSVGGLVTMLGKGDRKTQEIMVKRPIAKAPAFGEARRAVWDAMDVPIGSPDLQRRVARELWKNGDGQAAVATAYVADRSDPTVESAGYLAQWHLERGEFAKARQMAFEFTRRGGDQGKAVAWFGQAIELDPALRVAAQRVDLSAIADSAEDDEKGRVSISLRKAGSLVGRLEFAQRGDRTRVTRLMAAARLCMVMNCRFRFPATTAIRVEREQLRGLLGRTHAKRLRRLRWKRDPVTKRRFVDAVLLTGARSDAVTFPIEITKVWSTWLDPNSDDNVLSRRVSTFLVPWDRLDPNLRIKFAEALGDVSTVELAKQLSSLLLFDVLTSNSERFAKKKRDWGRSVVLDGSHLRSIQHTGVFPTRCPRRFNSAYKKLRRFNAYETFALSAMSSGVMFKIMFPESSRADERRFATFWGRRDEVLAAASTSEW